MTAMKSLQVVLSSDIEKSKKAAVEIGLSPDRLYTSVQEMLDKESAREDGVDVVAIMTPNDSHYEYCHVRIGAWLRCHLRINP